MLQKLHRSEHSRTDAQARLPTERLNPRTVKQDAWTIPHPPPLASCVRMLRRDSQVFTDPGNRVIDLAICIHS